MTNPYIEENTIIFVYIEATSTFSYKRRGHKEMAKW
jgi:hypothetical protein